MSTVETTTTATTKITEQTYFAYNSRKQNVFDRNKSKCLRNPYRKSKIQKIKINDCPCFEWSVDMTPCTRSKLMKFRNKTPKW